MDGKLTFLLSRRSHIFDGATTAGGRLQGTIKLKLHDDARSQVQDLADVHFAFPGPTDIVGLQAGIVRKMCPEPGAHDAETTKLVHVDLNDPGLPWRYAPNVSSPVQPWIVLVVGKAESFKDAKGNIQPPTAAVLKAHDLRNSHLWAHVQMADGKVDDGSLDDMQVADGREISRLVSPVTLDAFENYVAAIVPAFDSQGQPLWDLNGNPRSALPIYHYWEFSTGAPGDFESLVNLLRVRSAGNVGVVGLQYREEDIHLQLRGAITTLAADPSLQELPAAKLEKLHADLRALDERVLEADPHDGSPLRKIVGLPQYGYPWVDDPQSVPPAAAGTPSPWVRSLNDDPRYRAIAGMGTWLGIEAQEELMDAAVEQSGALQDIATKIRQLALGVDLSSRLWQRRLPDDLTLRLQVFGPALARLPASTGGSVLSQVTGRHPKAGRDSPLAAAQFSSAAMRMLRNGTSRTRHLQTPRTIDRKALLEAASQPPDKPKRDPSGVPLASQVVRADFDGPPLTQKVLDQISRFAGHRLTDPSIDSFGNALLGAGATQSVVNCVKAKLRDLRDNQRVLVGSREILLQVVGTCSRRVSQDFSVDVLVSCTPPVPPDRFTAIPLGPLGGVVSQAIDPTRADSPGRGRMQDVIGNFLIGNLAPPELPLGLDFPTWQLVKKYALDWLLPGVGTVPENSIVALQTNPVFVDAFLTGINAQFLAEARWRNLWIQRRFTPLRMFWGHIDPKTGRRTADIQPLSEWAKPAALTKDLGDKSHQVIDPRDASGNNDLVILFRTELFRRYPGTLVYLTKPDAGLSTAALDTFLKQPPDFTPPAAPNPKRIFGPIFMGNLTPDVVFFAFDIDPQKLDEYWLILDEPPAEMRFVKDHLPYKGPPLQVGPFDFDEGSIDRHTRVAISGAYLERMGGGA